MSTCCCWLNLFAYPVISLLLMELFWRGGMNSRRLAHGAPIGAAEGGEDILGPSGRHCCCCGDGRGGGWEDGTSGTDSRLRRLAGKLSTATDAWELR